MTAFIARSVDVPDDEIRGRWPERPSDPRLLVAAFGRFGLPERLS